MGYLAWIVLGGLAGWIASIIMGTRGSQGIITNIVIGIIGAFIGGYVFEFFGGAGVTGFNFYSLGIATVGAVILIWVTRLVRR